MGAELVLSLVGVVFLEHGTLFLDDLPVVFHPATVATVSAVGLTELGLVCGGGSGTVDSLLLRDVDGSFVRLPGNSGHTSLNTDLGKEIL